MAVSKASVADYPDADEIESGCKVGWRIYSDQAAAEGCARAARAQASILEQYGYDFGYCCPGSVETRKDGKFRVCVP
jgi:hypothetical protein